MFLPLRTECTISRTPVANYALIIVNFLVFAVFHEQLAGEWLLDFRDDQLGLNTASPKLVQFLTYQFLHADAMHLLANMLFLWVFGNGVNSKMGQWPFLLFYLAGGVFAAWGHTILQDGGGNLIGASGAVAAVTAAYLALFPRSHVTVLIFFVLMEWPAMLLIVLKIIVWDNVIAPSMLGAGNVAHNAHLSGYLFGFVGAMVMLILRTLPRDQFDMLALWRRRYQRRQLAEVFAPVTGLPGRTGSFAPATAAARTADDKKLDQIADLRDRIGAAVEGSDMSRGVAVYDELLAVDPAQVLSEKTLLVISRHFYTEANFKRAAAEFDRILRNYPYSTDAENVRLLLGIIYARDLKDYTSADEHLSKSWSTLRDEARRAQCFRWLEEARAMLGRELPRVENATAGG